MIFYTRKLLSITLMWSYKTTIIRRFLNANINNYMLFFNLKVLIYITFY